jgi:amino acid adenylation domain-containing protein
MTTHRYCELPQPGRDRRYVARRPLRLPFNIADPPPQPGCPTGDPGSTEHQLTRGSPHSSGVTGFTHDISAQGLGLVIPSIDGTIQQRINHEDLLRITFTPRIGSFEVYAKPVRVKRYAEGERTTYLIAAQIAAISNPQLYQQILEGVLEENPSLTCIHKLFEAQVKRTPHHIGVVFEAEQLTFEQLNKRANQLAHSLRKKGVGPDVLVGIFMERSLEMIIGMLAILKAGAAYVPVDPSYPGERVSFMLEDTRLSIILTQRSLFKKLSSQIAQIICVDTDEKEIREENSADLDCEVEPESLAYVIYTSGSTGKPKGVMIPHRAVCNYLSWMLEAFPLKGTDRVLQKAPFTFDASVWEFYLPLISGARLVMARPRGERDNDYLIGLIAQEGITIIQFVPSLLRLFLAARRLEICHSLKRVFSGGEALSVDIQERFFARLPAASLHNLYGPTETTIYSTHCRLRPDQKTVPIGKPIKDTRIYLLDQNLQPSPPGTVGEIHIGGAGLARGYLNRPELTGEKFIRHPFNNGAEERLYKTGDLARYLADGNLEFLGRVDQQVKIRGMRIELEEVETVLSRNPDVKDSVLVVREGTPGEKQLVAYVVPPPGSMPTTSELRAYLKERLPDYMLPSVWVLLETLPLTPNGKIDRRALPSPSHQRPLLAQACIEPQDEIESQLKLMWEELLNIQPVGVRDSFFELGGDSLLATQLLIKIQEVFDRAIPPSTLIEEATIECLSKIINSPAGEKAFTSLVRIQPQGTKPPIFFVHPLGGDVLGYRALARHLGEDQPFYGLRARGLDGLLRPLTDLGSIAAGYITEILNVQPQGPFLLGGYSSGGIIAFEMAQQLRAQGHKVAFLAILDEEAPRAGQSSWDPGFATRFMRDLPYWFVDHVIKRPLIEVAADVQRHLRKIAKRIVRAVFKPRAHEAFKIDVHDEVDLTNLPEQSLRVIEATYEALTNYKPRAYQGRITLYRTRAEALFRSHTTDKGWGSLASGGVDVIFVSGNHKNLYEEPYAPALAKGIEIALERCKQESSNTRF